MFVALLVGVMMFGQDGYKEHISNFNMTSFTYKHDKKWSAMMEAQLRSIDDYMLPDYYELKGGIGYNFIKNNQLFVGVGKYGTYEDRVLEQQEVRIWLQYVLTQSISSLKLDHRVRAEKRFYTYPQDGSKHNTERYRYRISATLPLKGDKVEEKSFFVNAFEEVFVGPKDNFFKRNRMYGGFGYQFSSFGNVNLGYMFQRDFSISSAKNLHSVYFAMNFTFDRLKHNEYHSIPVGD